MKRTVIATGTVTHAMKGREILRRHGYKADIERMKYGTAAYGCGYGLLTDCPRHTAEALLRNGNVKVFMVTETA